MSVVKLNFVKEHKTFNAQNTFFKDVCAQFNEIIIQATILATKVYQK